MCDDQAAPDPQLLNPDTMKTAESPSSPCLATSSHREFSRERQFGTLMRWFLRLVSAEVHYKGEMETVRCHRMK